jgi:hypothetical protein
MWGVAGMSLKAYGSSLVAKKSWFMFDNEIVCLGAGITASSGTNVHTIVENRRLNSSGNNAFTANGVALPTTLGWSSNFTGLSWCALSNAGGYFFPGGANIKAQRAARTGAWSDINAGGSTASITRNYLTLWLDHGVNPSAANYSYVILPNLTNAQVAAYAANPDIQILENSTQAQAVRENSLGILAVNFWNAATKTVDFITSNNRASVITRETLDDLTLAVSDPTQTNTGNVVITLNRSVLGVGFADAGVTVNSLSPTVQLTVNMNGRRGQPATVRLITYSNSPPALAPIANQTIEFGQTATAAISATDVGALPQLLRYSLLNPPAGAAINPTNGNFVWVPGTNAIGTNTQFTVVVTEDGWATNLSAVADTFVRSGFTANYGSNTTLDVRLAGGTTTREAYLRFAIPGDLRGEVRDAWLQLIATTAAPASLVHGVAQASNDAWGEYTVTWNDRPGYGPLLATWSPASEASADVSAVTRIAKAGSGLLSLAVVATNDPAGAVLSYGSREGDTNQVPRLRVVTTNGISLAATQTFWVTVQASNQPPVLAPLANTNATAGAGFSLPVGAYDPDLPVRRLGYSLTSAPVGATINPTTGQIAWTPPTNTIGSSNVFTVVVTEEGWETNLAVVADTFVRSGFANNYGSNSTLEVRLAGGTTTRETYLRFALPNLAGTVRSAKLQLTPTSLPPATLVHAVALASNSSWNEMTMTWNDRPGYGPLLSTWSPRTESEVDVSSMARTALSGNGVLSLAVVATNDPSGAALVYESREGDSSLAPRLNVVFTNGFERSATQSFWVVVTSANLPPVLPAQTNRIVYEFGHLVVTNTASDDFVPAGMMTYDLIEAPVGATISPNGLITWFAAGGTAGSSNRLVSVASDGELSATNQFAVVVATLPTPGLSIASLNDASLTLQLSAAVGVSCWVQASTNLVDWTTEFSTNAPAGPFFWTDPTMMVFPQRYYRVMIGP